MDVKNLVIPGLDFVMTEIKESWVVLKTTVKVNKTQILQFMMRALDVLIVYMVDQELPGADKKATVMKKMSDVYDWVVAQALPIWLMPFKSRIKDFILNVMISYTIDWIVSKYNEGSWSTAKQSVAVQMKIN